jgi:HTH-type transcriptional regulator, sugar sensing transcriptional regulator
MASNTRSRHAKQAARLQSLGLTEYEAIAYLILLQHHPATAYEIGKLGGLVKANVYPTLDSLVRRGAVQPVSQEPTRYVPIDPETFLSGVAKNTTTLCSDLVAELGDVAAENPVEYVWLLSSEKDIQSKISQMIAQAKRHIWIKGPESLLMQHRNALRDATKRGTKLVVILFGDESAVKRFRFSQNARVYLHEGSGMIVGAGESQLIVACDFNEALSANIAGHCEGAFTRNPSVVYLAESLIRHEIYLAEIIAAYEPQVEARFGKSLVSLRKHYLPERYVSDLQARLAASA